MTIHIKENGITKQISSQVNGGGGITHNLSEQYIIDKGMTKKVFSTEIPRQTQWYKDNSKVDISTLKLEGNIDKYTTFEFENDFIPMQGDAFSLYFEMTSTNRTDTSNDEGFTDITISNVNNDFSFYTESSYGTEGITRGKIYPSFLKTYIVDKNCNGKLKMKIYINERLYTKMQVVKLQLTCTSKSNKVYKLADIQWNI